MTREQMNRNTLPPHVLTKGIIFSTFLLICLCRFVLTRAAFFAGFLLHAYDTYLQQCQFYGVITCVYLSLSPYPFVKALYAQLFSCVYLQSFPPPLSLRLSSVITALDSSSDGKCFSIPLSPSLSLNRHRSLSLTKQITSWLL